MIKVNRLGYYWLNTWVMANVIQLATQEFCKKYLNLKNDPCGRQFDQMTQAARSGAANIAEGNSRHTTSKETEMKLTDVARASIAELAGDYFNWLLQQKQAPWSVASEEYKCVNAIQLDAPRYSEDVVHESGLHILAQKQKFDKWLMADDSVIAANCLLILCNRLIMMLQKQIETLLTVFTEEGGFTEALTAERLQYRTQESIEQDAPACPICGKPMIRRVAKKGVNSGKEFWSCTGYPDCRGTRKI